MKITIFFLFLLLRIFSTSESVNANQSKKLEELREGFSPLMWAIEEGNVETIKDRIKEGGDVNYQTSRGFTALTCAVGRSSENLEIVRLLIKAGANVNPRDEIGYSPLVVASTMGYAETIRLLIKAGADVDLQGSFGDNALLTASKMGYPEIVKDLIQVGAHLNLQDKNGYTPLMLLCEEIKIL